MSQNTKLITQLLLIGALVSILLLATSISNLQLKSGAPFPGGGDSDYANQSVTALPPVQTYSFPLLRGIFALAFLILMIYVPARLIVLVNKKRIIWLMLAMIILLIIVYLMPRIMPAQSAFSPNGSSELPTPLSSTYSVTPLGQPPQIFIQFVIIGIALGVGLLAIKIVKGGLGPAKIEEELLQEAEEAANALKAGRDLRNVILRCYMQMARILQEEQGIGRDYTMTVREFERWLGYKGFPSVPVRQLSSLFEKVRYGKLEMSNSDEQIALDSLNEIIQYCQGERI